MTPGLAKHAPKRKFDREFAAIRAFDLLGYLMPLCEQVVIAGSIRRRKEAVGDIEVLYISKFRTAADGLFDQRQINLIDEGLERLLRAGVIEKRLNVRGSASWGPNNKLARDCLSQVPVDFFQARRDNWFNLLVCRTGSAENNTRICMAAQAKGWKWNPYGVGFTNDRGELVPVTCEEDAFRLVGLPYLEPWER